MLAEQLWPYTAAETTEMGSQTPHYDFVSIDQKGFEKYKSKTLASLATSFMEYKG